MCVVKIQVHSSSEQSFMWWPYDKNNFIVLNL